MMNFEEIAEARREAVAATLRPLSTAEARDLADTLFPFTDDPWREQYLAFLDAHPGAMIYHATAPDDIQVLYAPGVNRGLWFVPRRGLGIIGARGLAVLAELTAGGR